MDQTNPAKLVTTAVGVAGGSALLAPVAVPTLHGLAGLAVVGLGLFTIGSVIYKAAGSMTGQSGKPQAKQATSTKII